MLTIDTWNALAAEWLDFLWRGAITVTLAGLVVTLVWRVLRRWSSAHLGYGLFLVPLILSVLPLPGLEPLSGIVAPTDEGALAPQIVPRIAPIGELWPDLVGRTAPAGVAKSALAAEAAALAESSLRKDAAPSTNGPPNDSPKGSGKTDTVTTTRGRLSPAAWLFGIWVTIVGALLLRFAIQQLLTNRLVQGADDLRVEDLPPGVREAVRPLVRGGVRLAESSGVSSPAAWGVLRPTLVLPRGLVRELSPADLRWILCHELAHVHRRDVAMAAFQRVVQILWFFHPVVWYIARQVDRLRECACDEAALARCRAGSRRSFAEVLVRLAARPELHPSALSIQGLFGPKSLLETRILRMLDTRRPIRRGLGLLSLPVLFFVAVSSALAADYAVGSSPTDAQGLAQAHPQARPQGRPQARPWDPPAQEKPKRDPAGEASSAATREQAQAAIEKGLEYLSRHQAEDGGWYAGIDESVPQSGEFDRSGVTGLVLLAYLEADRRDTEAVRRGLEFLRSRQDSTSGCFSSDGGFLYNPSHCVATLAWIRAHEGNKDLEEPMNPVDEGAREVARAAIHYLLRARNPYAGWRYTFPPDGDNDSFVTSLALQALAVGRDFGIETSEDAVSGGMSWLDEMTDDETGRTGYNRRGSPVSRLQATVETHPIEYTEMLTAMAISARLDWGQDPLDSKVIRDGALLVTKTAPLWSERRGSIDYYHWLFGTAALKRLGGFHWDHWKKLLDDALLPNQEQDGSWQAIDAWSSAGSTVHATALCTLTLGIANR